MIIVYKFDYRQCKKFIQKLIILSKFNQIKKNLIDIVSKISFIITNMFFILAHASSYLCFYYFTKKNKHMRDLKSLVTNLNI